MVSASQVKKLRAESATIHPMSPGNTCKRPKCSRCASSGAMATTPSGGCSHASKGSGGPPWGALRFALCGSGAGVASGWRAPVVGVLSQASSSSPLVASTPGPAAFCAEEPNCSGAGSCPLGNRPPRESVGSSSSYCGARACWGASKSSPNATVGS